MKAMIFAAGFGERMRPLTEHTPKPLLRAGGKPLLAYHLEALAAAGFVDAIINVSHLGQQIMDWADDGSRWGLRLDYSIEAEPLETAGGLLHAAAALGDEPFLVVNGDIWTDYPLATLRDHALPDDGLAHLVMVDNPAQHRGGDFALAGDGRLRSADEDHRGLTYAGIGVYRLALLSGAPPGRAALRPFLDAALAAGQLYGEHFTGRWYDIGTPQRLAALDALLTGTDSST